MTESRYVPPDQGHTREITDDRGALKILMGDFFAQLSLIFTPGQASSTGAPGSRLPASERSTSERLTSDRSTSQWERAELAG